MTCANTPLAERFFVMYGKTTISEEAIRESTSSSVKCLVTKITLSSSSKDPMRSLEYGKYLCFLGL